MTSRPCDHDPASGPDGALLLRLVDTRDLVAATLYVAGYRPRDSVVVLGLPRSGEPGLAVVGAGLAGGGEDDALARGLTEDLLATGRPERSGVLILTDGGDEVPMPREELAAALTRRLRRAGVPPLDVVHVGRARYRSYLCRRESCCPAEGFPLTDLEASSVTAEMVLRGAVLRDENDLVRDVLPAPGNRSTVPRGAGPLPGPAGRRLLRRWLADLADPADPAAPAGAVDVPSAPQDLLLALENLVLRDAVWASLTPGCGRVALTIAGGRPEAFGDEVFARPWDDARHVGRARTLLAGLARAAPPGHRAPVLSLLAWHAWRQDEPIRARLLAELALQERPAYTLAHLVLDVTRIPLPARDVVRARFTGRWKGAGSGG